MKNVFGVPYSPAQIDTLDAWVKNQSVGIANRIVSEDSDIKKQIEAQKTEKGKDFIPLENREVVALIAYLQRLGTDIKTTEVKTASN
jgi:cytochrome c oxidase cbb3-type subunit I/II